MRIVILSLLLAACSSLPRFEKSGYSIQSSERTEIFDVRISLPAGISTEQRIEYMTRAAGEECLARGFLFWDIGTLTVNSLRAFCYKQANKKSIGVSMDPKNIKELTVEDTLNNAHAPFKPRDVVRKIGGVEVYNAGSFKEQIFRLAESGGKTVTVKVERSGIALTLEAPFSEHREAVLTPELLEALRKKIP